MNSRLSFYFGNPWIGMFIKTNNEKTVVPLDTHDKLILQLSEQLKTEVIKISVGYSNLLGVYLAMNSKGVVLPAIADPEEVSVLKKIGLNVHVCSDKFNALGNNLLVNDTGGIASEVISKDEQKKIEDALGIEIGATTIANYKTVGSAAVAANNGFLSHFGTQEEEFELMKTYLKVNGAKGSINVGVGFIGYGVVANKHGYIAGGQSSTYELGRVEEALQYI